MNENNEPMLVELNDSDAQAIDGGTISPTTALAATIGLMALAPASVAVVTAGLVAGAFYVTQMVFSSKED